MTIPVLKNRGKQPEKKETKNENEKSENKRMCYHRKNI